MFKEPITELLFYEYLQKIKENIFKVLGWLIVLI